MTTWWRSCRTGPAPRSEVPERPVPPHAPRLRPQAPFAVLRIPIAMAGPTVGASMGAVREPAARRTNASATRIVHPGRHVFAGPPLPTTLRTLANGEAVASLTGIAAPAVTARPRPRPRSTAAKDRAPIFATRRWTRASTMRTASSTAAEASSAPTTPKRIAGNALPSFAHRDPGV